MGIFKRKETNLEPLKESSSCSSTQFSIAGVDSYNFIRGLRTLATDSYNSDHLLDRMLDDAIISAAVSIYIDDALQVDPQKNEIFWVNVKETDNNLEKELAKGLSRELNRFLKEDLRMSKNLRPIARRLIQYGGAVTRLDFVDRLEDDRLRLIDKNEKIFGEAAKRVNQMFTKDYSDKTTDGTSDNLTLLKEDAALSINYESNSKDLKEAIDDFVYNEYKSGNAEDIKNFKEFRTYLKESKGYKTLTEKYLKEETLKNISNDVIKRLVRGRWSLDILGQGTGFWELSAKGKVLAFIDVRRPELLIDPTNIIYFQNDTGKYQVDFEIGDINATIADKQYFTLKRGESYLDNARIAWQVLSALEDILMLTRMTRSALYRIFSIEVGNLDDRETISTLESLKKKIKSDETINVRDKVYNSDVRQIPLADSIFVPVRDGIGAINIQTVGGDVNLRDAIDLDYFKDKLFAALRIPKAFLGFGDDTGGLMNTSLTRMDIRYARTVRGIQSILAEGMKDICLRYLELTRAKNTLDELPDFDIVFTSVNTEEDVQRNENRKTQIETAGAVIEAFSKLGIEVNDYGKLRNEIIRDYFGSDYLELIKEQEDENPALTVEEPNNDAEDDFSISGSSSSSSLPSSSASEFKSDIDVEEPTSDEGTIEEPASDDLNDEDFESTEDKEEPNTLTRELK